MKSIVIAIVLILFGSIAFAESVYVDATKNCLGPNGGTWKHIRVKKGITYEITIESNDAVFNTKDGAKFVNLGVMYVQPPRKMKIVTIEPKKKIYVETEGNLYFFFVDDAGLNRGGARVSFRKAKKKIPEKIAKVKILSGPIKHKGHDYYLLDKSTWTSAEAQAVSMGGHLTSINDQAENDWVWDTFSNRGKRSLWIGLIEKNKDGNFIWTNGDAVSYTNWQTGQPNKGEGYTQMRYGQNHTNDPPGRWNDLHNVAVWDRRGIHGVVEIDPNASKVKSDKKKIEDLEKENARLKEELLKKIPTKGGLQKDKNNQKSMTCVYMGKGKPKSAAWVEKHYKLFRDKIAIVDGKAYDIGRAVCDADGHASGKSGIGGLSAMRSGVMPPIGSYYYTPEGLTGAKILSVISDSECLVTTKYLLFHVRGVKKSLVDDANFRERLVCVGKYRYTSAGGSIKTIPSYEVYSPITKEQFVDIINGGFQLVAYKAIIKKKTGGGFSGKAPLWKIISRPIK